jgi:flagellar motor switch protein FliG
MSLEVVPFAPASPEPATGREAPPKYMGARKAAVMLVSLGREHAAEILQHMREEEIEALSLEMAELRHVQPAAATAVLEEFAATVQARESLLVGGLEYANEVLEHALGSDRAREIIGRMSSVIEKRPFEFLSRTPASRIVSILRDESPATMALVICNLHTTLAAQVLSQLPEPDQPKIAERIARIGDVDPEIVRLIEARLRRSISTVASEELSVNGGIQCAADILRQTGQATERNVLDQLSDTNRELADELRERLFTFNDIARLDDHAIQLILREADAEDVAIAIRGTADEVSERILSNVSHRRAEMLREDFAYTRPQLKRTIDAAQGRIVAIARRLQDSGAIIIARDDDIIM